MAISQASKNSVKGQGASTRHSGRVELGVDTRKLVAEGGEGGAGPSGARREAMSRGIAAAREYNHGKGREHDTRRLEQASLTSCHNTVSREAHIRTLVRDRDSYRH